MTMLARVLVLLLLLAASTAAAQEDFTIIVLPDTQNYSEFRPEIFKQQTQWIVNNRAALNIKFVIGVGDIVNDWDSTTQWQNADAAIDLLDNASVPYALAIGDHDYDNGRPSGRQAIQFNNHFGPNRYTGYSWYKGHFPSGSNENFYVTFSAGGADYLVLLMEMHPRLSAVDWARSVVRNHPSHRVILATHSYLHKDHTRVDECDTNDLSPRSGLYADPLWYQFIREEPTIIMALGGHITGVGATRRSDRNESGQVVHQFLQNYQDFPNSGDGWLRIYSFRPSVNQIELKTYSPYRDSLGKTAFLTDSQNQATLPIVQSGASASGTGTISGRVRKKRVGSSSDCTGISGADVFIPGAGTTTDSTGSYTLPAPAPGTHSTTVEKSGWATQSRDARVWTGFTERLEFFLTASDTAGGSCSTSTTGVKICSPGDGANVSSPVAVSAAAAHSSGIQFMQIYVDGSAVATVSGSSLEKSVEMARGGHRLTVQAKTNDGTYLKQSIEITVGDGGGGGGTCTPPSTARTLKICAPADGATVSSPVHISAAAQPGSTAITRMNVWVDGVKKYEKLNTTSIETDIPMTEGAHRVTVQAADSAGVFKTVANITVGSDGGSCGAPASGVNICSPGDGASVSSPVGITAAAGHASGIKFTQIYVDGSAVATVNGGAIDQSVSMESGAHRITVQAKANDGTYLKDTINLTVSGGTTSCAAPAAGVNICSPANGATVSSPVRVTAKAGHSSGIKFTQIYVDGNAAATANGGAIDQTVSMGTGSHRVTVQAKANDGTYLKQTVNITVP